MVNLIDPHGGRLVNRIAKADEAKELEGRSVELPAIEITRRELCDLELIANGAYSPLEGFLEKEDFVSVLENKRLRNGLPWTIPITLSVNKKDAKKLGNKATLSFEGNIVAIIDITGFYEYPKEKEAKKVYLTDDPVHPGVKQTLQRANVLVSGKITLIKKIVSDESGKYSLDPAVTRNEISQKQWKTVVAFQTRNPIHRTHEYLLKTALESHDGLLIHPLVGETKKDDIPADVRIKAYEALIEGYFPKERVLLSTLPASMRYADPREAVHHAIIRKNYGATHFIVGRDHAGVGNFYGPYDAQKIFDEYKPEEIGITPVFFEHTFYCKKCRNLASQKTCPHTDINHLKLSGTQVRNTLKERGKLPVEFTRPEVAEILTAAYNTTAESGLTEAIRKVGL